VPTLRYNKIGERRKLQSGLKTDIKQIKKNKTSCNLRQCLHKHVRNMGPGGGGVLPEKFGRGVRNVSQNPYPIYEQNL